MAEDEFSFDDFELNDDFGNDDFGGDALAADLSFDQDLGSSAAEEVDEFDALRQRSSNTADSYQSLEEQIDARPSGVLARFSPGQRLILALLLLLDIIVVGLVILVIAGIVSL